MITTALLDYKWDEWSDEERDTKRSIKFWIFNIACFLNSIQMLMINGMFLWFALWDANRRIYLMRKVSGAIELDFHTKDNVNVRMPTLNFLDPMSLLTWLETRKLVLDTGIRFQIRIQYYVTFYLCINALQVFLVFLVASGLVSYKIFTIEQWVLFLSLTIFLFVFLLMILLSTAYLNQEMEKQIKRLIKIRETY